jgi:hypothetical protein
MILRRRSTFILGTSYAALVDILLATVGIFIVVFAQLQIDDSPRLVQRPIDGIAICTGVDTFEVYDAMSGTERVTTSSFRALSDEIQRLWPDGASIMVGVLLPCAISRSVQNLWQLETDIRRLENMSRSYRIEVVPLTDAQTGTGSLGRILDRWRQTVLNAPVSE